MAPKKAATKAPKAEPAAKKPKVEEKKEEPKKEEPKKEEPKKEEPKKEDAMEVDKAEAPPPEPEEVELEKDDKPDSRPTLKESISFEPNDMTLNVVPAIGGKVLMTLSEGGMQYFIAGARANVGMKAGRYLFEAKVVQTLNTNEGQGAGRGPRPKHLIRVGFSTSKSSLILGDSEDSVCFDAEGQYMEGAKKLSAMKKTKPGVSAKFGKGVTVAVLLNLDEKSENKSTISLFKDGVRVSDPKPLPENLKGKTLYPHVSYRAVSVQVNFGPTAMTKLPFTCKTIQAAAVKDIAKQKASAPEDGKFEVMVPVAFPDEGTFEWADSYLEKNPKFIELSDRKILEWAKKSGIWKAQGGGGSWGSKASNDKPSCQSGLPMIDDFSVRKVINAVAPVVPRNYLIMEVKANLIAEERKQVLKRFNYPCYKKVANVIMGEPSDSFKDRVQAKLLATKQAKYDQKWKAQKAAEKKKKLDEKRKRDAEKARKKAEKARKKAAEERKKKLEEAKKKAEEEKKAKEAEKKAKEEAEKEKKEGEEKKEEKAEEKKEEKKEEEKKEEEKKEEEKKDDDDSEEEEDEPMEDEPEGEPEKQELTEEEKQTWYMPKGPTTDLTVAVLNSSFGKFTTPEKDEGFDEIKYEWQPEKKAKDYLKTWVLEKKLTSRIDDLKPGAAAVERLTGFKKLLAEWQEKQKAFKAGGKKKPVKKADDEDEDKDVDIYSVADVCDIGDGVPLFEKFEKEDWILMQTRFEFHHLVRSFKEDTQDADRLGIHEDHFAFYYNRYFSKSLNPKPYGCEDFAGLVTMIKDTVTLDTAKKVMSSPLEDNLEGIDIFVKLTEECRRERQRRLDAGDETARLKFSESLKMSLDKKGPPAATPAKGASKGTPAPKKK